MQKARFEVTGSLVEIANIVSRLQADKPARPAHEAETLAASAPERVDLYLRVLASDARPKNCRLLHDRGDLAAGEAGQMPFYSEIAFRLGMSRSAVQRQVQWLRDLGLLGLRGSTGRGNALQFTIVFEKLKTARTARGEAS